MGKANFWPKFKITADESGRNRKGIAKVDVMKGSKTRRMRRGKGRERERKSL